MRHLPLCAALATFAVIAGIALLWESPQKSEDVQPRQAVVVHVAAALRKPMEKAAEQFQKEKQIPIELRFNSSEVLLSNLKLTHQGDLFVPADSSYVDEARKEGLVEQSLDLATMQGVFLFRKDFPKQKAEITWDDVFKDGFKLAQPNQATAIGKLTRDGLLETGLWDRLEKLKPVSVGTVVEAANAVKLGSVDGAIIWDAVAKSNYPELIAVALPQLDRVRANVTAAVCKDAVSRGEARIFAQYLENEGQVFFREAGYNPPKQVEAPNSTPDSSVDRTEILLYSGSMLRPAIEETIKEFEEREKVRVTRVYNGCGILVGQMKTGKHPDLYFACDQRFMGEVEELFHKPTVVSKNQLVIAVPKGNPAGIKGLPDLGKEGLRIGVGHEQQCALGAITKETFIKAGVYGRVRDNVKLESPTGDLLVNQLMTGSLDAVVCYISNVHPNESKLDSIPILNIPCAAPQQPVAIARDSKKQDLAAKLIQLLQTKESKKRFEEYGFGWEVKEPKK